VVTKTEPEYAEVGFCNVVWSNDCKDPAGFRVGSGVRASGGKGKTRVRCNDCDEFACSECRVQVDGEYVCLLCMDRRTESVGVLEAASTPVVEDHTAHMNQDKIAKEPRTTVVREGVSHIYLGRECYKYAKHEAHPWDCHMFGWDKEKRDNAWCPGRTVAKQVTTYKSKPKKDYSEDSANFPVSDPITVSQARAIAYDMHKDQKDKSDRPYKEHLEAVCKGVQVLGGGTSEQVAALFHDAVEDYHTTYDLLRKINVTETSIKMIEAVSKRPSEEQGKYLARIKEAGPGAMRVKLADLLHNTRHDRIQALRDDKKDHTADRLLKKYRPSIAALMLELGLIVDEDEQKKFATKPQGSAYSGTYGGYYPSSKDKTTAKSSKDKVTTPVPEDEDHSGPVEWEMEVVAESLMINDFDVARNHYVDDVEIAEDGKVEVTYDNGAFEVYDPKRKIRVTYFE
jgi:hypothetical protein